MTLSHSTDIQKDKNPENKKLGSEAQTGVDAFAKLISDILKENPEKQKIALKLLGNNIRGILRKDPGEMRVILGKVDSNYLELLNKMNPSEQKLAKKDHSIYSNFISNLINSSAQNVRWDDQCKSVNNECANKKESLISTYHTIQEDLYKEITGEGFPTTKTA